MILLAAINASPAAAHLGGGGVDLPVGRIVLSLLACLAIAVLAVLFLRQRGGRVDLRTAFGRLTPRRGLIDVLEVRRASLHGDLCLVRHDGREYLLLLQAGAATVLREREAPDSDGWPE